ncbi:LysM peptidoglycan-binding domain-containing protein [Acinetobacter sp. MD2(2019)]|uniref:LysM peptidoglycan-binding domain-containing protein n=1 Tax=Acinetobacter sp. MD2(2019) TaxID=2605273 RepID=UPI002D1F6774|nr:LysM peptidoglycan-binding domain-containing protein [Acinetobacter sp. MD2(2019)]MEB3754929.1 LysM peptidoglycan-binding domain-containing protein [Acinetobacter sp. MD2(2019)]
MKKVLVGKNHFSGNAVKKHLAALMLGLSVSTAFIGATHASPNTTPPSIKANAPHVYVVRKGDTLWDIAGKFLKNPWRWKDIWANNRHVKNPHWIYPGDHLLLCSYQGHPLIGKDEGDGCDGIVRRHLGAINLKPQVRVEALGDAISIVPLKNIEVWLKRATILPPNAIKDTPYIVGTADERLLAGAGQTIYAKGNGLAVGQRYGVYRQTTPYTAVDAAGKSQTIALELMEVATGVSTDQDGQITTLELDKSYDKEVRRGDLVLPELSAELPSYFYTSAPKQVTEDGKIIRILDNIGSAAKNSVVTIDRGRLDGAQAGQVFSVYQKGSVVSDIKTGEKISLPKEQVGTIMILRSFDHLSYAYVLESTLPIKTGAFIATPAASD